LQQKLVKIIFRVIHASYIYSALDILPRSNSWQAIHKNIYFNFVDLLPQSHLIMINLIRISEANYSWYTVSSLTLTCSLWYWESSRMPALIWDRAQPQCFFSSSFWILFDPFTVELLQEFILYWLIIPWKCSKENLAIHAFYTGRFKITAIVSNDDIWFPYISAWEHRIIKILVSIPHNQGVIMGDRHNYCSFFKRPVVCRLDMKIKHI
jgi:hypothetical protein